MRTLQHHITATQHPSTLQHQFITATQHPSTHASAASVHHSNAAPLLTHTLLLLSLLPARTIYRSPPAITQEKDLANAQPLRDLLIECSYKHGKAVSKADANKMNFAQLRDGLLALAPLDRAHVIAVNTGKAAQHTQTAQPPYHLTAALSTTHS